MCIPLVIFLLKTLHVLSNVSTENILLKDLRIQSLAFGVVTREALVVVGNKDSTIASSFQSTEQTRSSGSSLETNVEIGLEGAGSIFLIEGFGKSQGAIGFCDTFVLVGQSKFGESTASAEETSGIGYSRVKIAGKDVIPMRTHQQPNL
jgi:hypothetical protein